MTYGLPPGTAITYGSPGFPAWVYQLGEAFNVKASTYAGHQETARVEAGFAPNPQHLNRGIDWAGSVADMQRFADYLLTVKESLEQVIWGGGRKVGVAGSKDVTATGYYRDAWAGHQDHVHTRQSQPIPLPGQKEPTVGWTGDPVWLADVLRAEGLRCDIAEGAFDRGHGDMGDIWGVLCHHTGSNNASWQSIAYHPTLGLASQLYLSQEGVYTLCGVGVAWHAGEGSWPGVGTNNGNQRLIGIEAANDGGGKPGKPHRSSWPDKQYNAYVRGVAAILRKLGYKSERAIAHKEWAGATQGKWDPGAITMDLFRADVAAKLKPPAEVRNLFMALTDQQQTDLYNAVMAIAATVVDTQVQMRGPGLQGWPQLGQNSDGKHLTLVDAIAKLVAGDTV